MPVRSRTKTKTPTTRRPQRGRGALRADAIAVYRAGILDAAERVFGRAEFRAARMADIAAEAGLAAGTLYNYFENKEQIFQALVELRTGELVDQLRDIAHREDDARARLDALIRASLRYLEEHRALFAIFAQLGALTEWSVKRAGGEPAERAYGAHFAIYETAIRQGVRAGLLRTDVPPRLQTIILTGAMNGLVREWLVRDERGVLARAADDLLTLLIEGIGQR